MELNLPFEECNHLANLALLDIATVQNLRLLKYKASLQNTEKPRTFNSLGIVIEENQSSVSSKYFFRMFSGMASFVLYKRMAVFTLVQWPVSSHHCR